MAMLRLALAAVAVARRMDVTAPWTPPEDWSRACKTYMETVNCGWTESWNCPGQNDGEVGVAVDDGKKPYQCCCKEEGWRSLISHSVYVKKEHRLKHSVQVEF